MKTSILAMKGIVPRLDRPITLEEMDEAIARAVGERDARSKTSSPSATKGDERE